MMSLKGLLASILLIMPVAQASAETPEEKGLSIVVEADRRDTGWADSTADMKMILKNRSGDSTTREIRVKSLEVESDGDKTLTIFDQPRDVKGTAFLSFSHPVVPDEQWLYLPSIKRVKRISSNNKSGPFMGSEFAYEDISSFEIEKYTYKYLRDDQVDGFAVFVVEMYPEYEHSGYTRQVAYIDKEEYRFVKIEFFDRKDSQLKVLTSSDFSQYLDKFWRPGRMFMENLQNGKTTELLWQNYQFKVGLDENDFSQVALKRAK